MYVLQCILNTSYNAMMYKIYGDGDGDNDNVHDNDDDYCKRDGDDVEDIEIRLLVDIGPSWDHTMTNTTYAS